MCVSDADECLWQFNKLIDYGLHSKHTPYRQNKNILNKNKIEIKANKSIVDDTGMRTDSTNNQHEEKYTPINMINCYKM